MAGLYVHIPFCASRCIYCGFYSTTMIDMRDAYVDALIQELRHRKDTLFAHPTTVYFGGGTPSVLTLSQLERLVSGIAQSVDTNDVAEWTIECNPDDVTPQLAEWIGNSPINRVSMGVQTFDDTRLKWLNRRHRASQVYEAVCLLRRNGIDNISLDLIFGFPNQSLEQWHDDLCKMIELRPQHISAYSLMYDDDTPLMHMYEQGRVEPVTDECSRQMYYELIDALTTAGYEQYEISNFSLLGSSQPPSRYRSRHNSSYWQQVPYLGIGASAHSYDMHRRWWNVSDLCRYIANPCAEITADNSEQIDDVTRYNDIITTALRTVEGIPLDILTTTQRNYLIRQAQPHIARKTLLLSSTHLHLTRQGLFVSDDIMSDLILLDTNDL